VRRARRCVEQELTAACERAFPAPAKLGKARELGVAVLTEENWLGMVGAS
jgi:hypothetical protein